VQDWVGGIFHGRAYANYKPFISEDGGSADKHSSFACSSTRSQDDRICKLRTL